MPSGSKVIAGDCSAALKSVDDGSVAAAPVKFVNNLCEDLHRKWYNRTGQFN